MSSPTERLTARDGALWIVDVQEKLLARIAGADRLVAQCVRLVHAARELGVLVHATEQYPKGLGPTAPPLAELIPHRPEKTTFHCCAAHELLENLHGRKVRHVTLAGLEAHVCIAQTALELLHHGFRVQVVADAVASRNAFDAEIALRRLERAGAVVSTAEAVLFEWLESADHPRFKAISALVKDFPPPLS